MVRYSQIFRGLIFAFALALAASPGLAQNNGKGKGHENKGGPKMEKDKPGKDKMREMSINLMNVSLGGYGKNGGSLKYSWKYKLAREAMLKDSWAIARVWYSNDEVIERRENISLEAGNDSIRIPDKGNYYPVRYDIVVRANYTLDGMNHYMEDKMAGRLPKMMGKDEPIKK